MLHEPHFKACMNLKETLTQLGLAHDWLTGKNESLVHRGRMEMTASFLKTDFSHMMWLDADIEFTPDDVAKVWNLEADIGVGVYAMKKRDQCWYAAWKDGALVKNLDQFRGPVEVDYAGTGFMLIKREVVDGVYKHLINEHAETEKLLWRLAGDKPLAPEDEKRIRRLIESQAPDYMGPHGRVPALYMTPINNDGLDSEDYYFSRIAREAGYKVVMDPTVRLKHWGQYAYGA
jgi:hypothetical protein